MRSDEGRYVDGQGMPTIIKGLLEGERRLGDLFMKAISRRSRGGGVENRLDPSFSACAQDPESVAFVLLPTSRA